MEHRAWSKALRRAIGEHLDPDGATEAMDAANERDDEALAAVQLRRSRG
jgi:hypothetical protein